MNYVSLKNAALFVATASAFADACKRIDSFITDIPFYPEAIKANRRLTRCLNRFQKIEYAISAKTHTESFDVYSVFSIFYSQGHTLKNALLLTKMTLRREISPYTPTYNLSLLQLELKFEERTFLKKESKNVPHYRDIEFKHKKKRI
jgi:hypothetical protein